VAAVDRDRFVEIIILQQINWLTMRPEQIKSKLNIQKKTIAIMVKQAGLFRLSLKFVLHLLLSQQPKAELLSKGLFGGCMQNL
jgi:hypothetical protein